MKTVLNYLIAGLAFGAVTVAVADYALSLPDVHVSYASGECVGVENFQGAFFNTETYSCENLPSKYNHVWVK